MRKTRTDGIALSPIKEIELAAARIPGMVSLAQGIPSFDTPEVIKAYVAEKMAQGEVARYSLAPGLLELRELVAAALAREGMGYDPDGEIIITVGAIEAIAATLLALTTPGAEIILPSPSYASYQQVIRMAGCEPVFVPLHEERNFDLDVDAISRHISPRTAAIFYCNPNNPTGTIYSREQSLSMMALAEQHDLLIITDEVYKDFLYTDVPYFTPAQEETFRDRVVRIFSFSKAYAMTGWRVGYLHAGRGLVTEILKVHDAMVTCAPVIAQHAAIAALEYGEESVREFRQAYLSRRNLMLQHLDALSDVFDYQKPDGAYFVFPRVKDTVPLCGDSRGLAFDLLEKARVALVPGIAFGPSGESHLRMSFGRREQDIEEAFVRLRRYFRPTERTRAAAAMGPPEPADLPAPAASVRGGARRLAVRYLHGLARWYLWRHRPVVVAIAGMQGKTVVKRILHGLLDRHWAVRSNPRSYNTEIGLPLAVLGLEIDPSSWRRVLRTLLAATAKALFSREAVDVLVVELGARRRGDMAPLLATVRPRWAVVTNLTLEGEDDAAELDVREAEVRLLCEAVAPERLFVSTGDSRLARTQADLGCGGLDLARFTATPGGFSLPGRTGRYWLGADLVGESALLAAQAAVLLGEAMGIPAPALQDYLAEISGLHATHSAPVPAPGAEVSPVTGGAGTPRV